MAYAPVTLAKLKQEVEKCDVRCANCHRKRTAKRWRYTLRTRMKVNDGPGSEPLTFASW
jgi:hypothetical protein